MHTCHSDPEYSFISVLDPVDHHLLLSAYLINTGLSVAQSREQVFLKCIYLFVFFYNPFTSSLVLIVNNHKNSILVRSFMEMANLFAETNSNL